MSVMTVQPPPARSAPVLEGEVFQQVWSGWFRRLVQTLNGNLSAGFSGTITTAKLTPGGADGSMTFTNGILTSQTPAT